MAPGQSEGPAELQRQVDELRARIVVNRADIDALQHDAAEGQRRLHVLEERADLDRALIEELLAEGLLNREQVENLHEALRSSRMIGAAIGIIMANRTVTQDEAFSTLRRASQFANRKLRLIAEDVVNTGDVSGLPIP